LEKIVSAYKPSGAGTFFGQGWLKI